MDVVGKQEWAISQGRRRNARATVGKRGAPEAPVTLRALDHFYRVARRCPILSRCNELRIHAHPIGETIYSYVFDDDDFDDGKGSKKTNILLRNVVKVEDVDDPMVIVEEILSRTDLAMIKKLYNIEGFTSPLEFLTMLALTTGRLLKGGTPNILGAACQVLMDWNHQKIPYFSAPPAVHPSLIPSTVPGAGGSNQMAPGAETVGQAQIVAELAKPFSLDGLFGAADAGAFGFEPPADAEMVDEETEDFPEEMDEDGKQMESDDLAPHIPRKRSRSPSVASTTRTSISAPTASSEGAPPPAPKRLRRSHDVPAYDAPVEEHARCVMASANPLGGAC